MIVAGIGCRRGCSADEIVAIVREAEHRAGCRVGRLAAPAFKRHEPGLPMAARLLGVELAFVEPAVMQAMQPYCPTRSTAAERRVGVASVAEAAALAVAGGRLLLPRIAGARATCALAT